MIHLTTVDILGVRVACLDKPGILAVVRSWVECGCKSSEGQARPGCEHFRISYVNAHCLNTAARDSQYHNILNSFDLVYPDGIGVVLAGQYLGQPGLHKVTGRDWIKDFCQLAVAQGWRIYILAGKPGIARRAAESMAVRWPGLHIVGCCDGYFVEKAEQVVLCELAADPPDVLFVGMGSPLQEKWLAHHQEQLDIPVCWAVGALFDYVAGDEAPVPSWMDRMGFEWLWRLMIDPLGKWRRYLIGNPLFVARVLGQKMGLRR